MNIYEAMLALKQGKRVTLLGDEVCLDEDKFLQWVRSRSNVSIYIGNMDGWDLIEEWEECGYDAAIEALQNGKAVDTRRGDCSWDRVVLYKEIVYPFSKNHDPLLLTADRTWRVKKETK